VRLSFTLSNRFQNSIVPKNRGIFAGPICHPLRE